LVLGEKVAEEKGSAVGMSIKSVGADGIATESSFVSEIQGFGRFPSGKNMGTITAIEGPKTSRGTGQGVCVTNDGEALPWHYSAIGRRVGDKHKSVAIVTFSTLSQKYAWMNDLLLVLDIDISLDYSQFSDTAYEWI
jgi:hypothetical protein